MKSTVGEYCDARVAEKCWLFTSRVIPLRLFCGAFIAENVKVDVDRLRAETRNEHEAVEALVPLMHEALTREQYADTLRRMYTVVHGWELWAATHAPAEYRELFADRRRSHLIQDDLAFLGAEPAKDIGNDIPSKLSDTLLQERSGATASPAGFLGAMYVMEGSTLGGQYIARFVEEKLAFPEGKGDTYFRGYLDRTGSMWQNFKQHLIALPDDQTDQVIAAARFMFRAFGDAMSAT